MSWFGQTYFESMSLEDCNNVISSGDVLKVSELKKEKKNNTDPKLEAIKKQFEEAGVSDLFGTKKEVRHLPEVLRDQEVIKYATSGISDGHTYLIVLTDKRLFFVNNNWTWGSDFKEFSFKNINSVTYSKGALMAKVAITNGADTTMIESISKDTAPILVDKMHEAMDEYEARKYQQPVQQAPKDNLSELRELKALLDEGIITQDDFEAKKKQILGI